MIEAVYMLLVMGCADDLSGCRTIATVEQAWPTAAACSAAINGELMQHTAADYPVIAAECIRNDAPATAANPEPLDLPHSAG